MRFHNRPCATFPTCCKGRDWYYRPYRHKKQQWVRVEGSADMTERRANESAVDQERKYEQAQQAQAAAPPPPPAPIFPRLSAYIAEYVGDAADGIARRATCEKMHGHLLDFLVTTGDRPINEIPTERIRDWRKALLMRPSKMSGGTVCKNTAQRWYNSVRGFFRYAAEHLTGFVNPCNRFAIKTWEEAPATERPHWRPEHLTIVSQELPPHFALPIEIGLSAVVRRIEVLSLRVTDLCDPSEYRTVTTPDKKKLKLGYVTIWRHKKRVGRVRDVIRLPAGLIDRLRAHATPEQPYLLLTTEGKPWAERAGSWSSMLTKEINALDAKYPGMGFKGLCSQGARHTAATTAGASASVSPRTLQDAGGWGDLRMVVQYTHANDIGKELVAIRLAERFKVAASNSAVRAQNRAYGARRRASSNARTLATPSRRKKG